jgi:hypothetical protein
MRVYISHASEDHEAARSLFHRLKNDGFDPWLDEYSFGPGEWEPQIEPAIRSSNVFVFLVSRASTSRPGLYEDEIKFALKLAREDPVRSPTIVPLRLDDSKRPIKLAQYLSFDLYSPLPQMSSDGIDAAGYDPSRNRSPISLRKPPALCFHSMA